MGTVGGLKRGTIKDQHFIKMRGTWKGSMLRSTSKATWALEPFNGKQMMMKGCDWSDDAEYSC